MLNGKYIHTQLLSKYVLIFEGTILCLMYTQEKIQHHESHNTVVKIRQ